jgi:type II secretory pathway component PulF
MTNTEQVSPWALKVYTHQFATLINAGVSIMRSMKVLSDTAIDDRLRTINDQMMVDIEQGHTLSGTMKAHPEVFGPRYVALVRAGEVGGILDETLVLLAELMDREAELRQRFRLYALVAASVAGPAALDLEERVEAALSRVEAESQTALFCQVLGMLMEARVPLKLALETAAAMYPPEQAATIREVAQSLREDEAITARLAATGLLPPGALQLLAVGEETGALPLLAQKAAEFLRYQAEAEVEAELSISPAHSVSAGPGA